MQKKDKAIEIKCEAKEEYLIEKLIPFQGKLKSIDKEDFDKLKSSLVNDGLPLGFHVWKQKDKVFVIDGHHRLLALKALQDEGYFCGMSVPPLMMQRVSDQIYKQWLSKK